MIFYGILRIDNTVDVYRFTSPNDIIASYESNYVKDVTEDPFEASDRAEALQIVKRFFRVSTS